MGDGHWVPPPSSGEAVPGGLLEALEHGVPGQEASEVPSSSHVLAELQSRGTHDHN